VKRSKKIRSAESAVRTGAKARSFVDNAGTRLFLPYRVTYETQMTPEAATTQHLAFYLYAQDQAEAVKVAGKMVVLWQVSERRPVDGYPKPVDKGQASAEQISDKEFLSDLQQARNEGLELRCAHDPQDPTGFHIKPKITTIYVPATLASSRSGFHTP
jgi:hypothetical protein